MKFGKITALAALLSMGCVGAYAQTSTWKIDPYHSSSTFAIGHMSVAIVRGMIVNIHGNVVLDEKDITKSNVTATLDMTTIDTGVAMRDADLKSDNFFDVAKYPTMTFKSTAVTRAGGKLKLIGDLTINTVTKSVTLDMEGPSTPQKQTNGKVLSGFSATGNVKRSDFGIGPKYAPKEIGDDVKLTIDVQIEKQ